MNKILIETDSVGFLSGYVGVAVASKKNPAFKVVSDNQVVQALAKMLPTFTGPPTHTVKFYESDTEFANDIDFKHQRRIDSTHQLVNGIILDQATLQSRLNYLDIGTEVGILDYKITPPKAYYFNLNKVTAGKPNQMYNFSGANVEFLKEVSLGAYGHDNILTYISSIDNQLENLEIILGLNETNIVIVDITDPILMPLRAYYTFDNIPKLPLIIIEVPQPVEGAKPLNQRTITFWAQTTLVSSFNPEAIQHAKALGVGRTAKVDCNFSEATYRKSLLNNDLPN